MIYIDLKQDVINSLLFRLKQFGISRYQKVLNKNIQNKDNYLSDLLHEYLILQRKRITPQRRKVILSHELRQLNDPRVDFISKKLEQGEDITKYLSKKINGKNNDLLLYDWSIHHIHFSPERTKDMLFAYITFDTAYLLAVMSHEEKGTPNRTWANSNLVEILHRNWPNILSEFKINGVRPDNITNEERTILRKNCGNAFVTMSDGTVYSPIGEGYTVTGLPILETILRDSIIDQLATLETFIIRNELLIRQSLKIDSKIPINFKAPFEEGPKKNCYRNYNVLDYPLRLCDINSQKMIEICIT